MKKLLPASMLFALLSISGCSLFPSSAPTSNPVAPQSAPVLPISPSSGVSTEAIPEPQPQPEVAPVPTPKPAPVPAPVTAPVHLSMIAKQWEFVPSTITVKQGADVTIDITSQDVEHGFSLSAYGISETLSPGKTVSVHFVADKKGTFTFSCSVFCGAGHSHMSGTLVVE